jgi:hypothetical protein
VIFKKKAESFQGGLKDSISAQFCYPDDRCTGNICYKNKLIFQNIFVRLRLGGKGKSSS